MTHAYLDPAAKNRLDAILAQAVKGQPGVPGVVAMLTDRDGLMYQGAAGKRRLDAEQPMTTDTVFALFSCTKALTAVTVLQCVEDGLLDLDAPAKNVAPALGDLQVLTGFAADGTPQTRPSRSEITTRQLLLHTAGFGYGFFNADYARLMNDHSVPPTGSGALASLQTPLLFDPGTAWEYGTSMDWAGLVVEGVRGAKLSAVMKDRVLDPLGMGGTAFRRSDAMRALTATLHMRGKDGTLTPRDDFALPEVPEVEMGGHGLYGTVGNFMAFIRMWLNNGMGAEGPILRPETIAWASQNGLQLHQQVKPLTGVISSQSNDVDMFPGSAKGWAYSFMTNDAEVPTGRSAGSLGWAGLANLYYWIDPAQGIGGFWGTQIMPFIDPASYDGALAFETAVYDVLR